MADDDLGARLADIARELAAQSSPEETAETLTRLAVELVAGADDAGVSLRRARGRIETVGPTSPMVAWADELQHELTEGPCVDAIDADEVETRDLAADDRWPRWRPPVVEKGVGSMFCVQLHLDDRKLGALNLYATRPRAFDEADRTAARHLAAHAAIAVSAASERDTLRAALASRTVIGQAEGMLMERYRLDADRAFAVLVRCSQHSNIKLATVADRFVAEGELPSAAS